MVGGGEDVGNAGVFWVCWFCTRVFLTTGNRHRHMSAKHPGHNRIVPPPGFVELHLRAVTGHQHRAAAAGELTAATQGDVQGGSRRAAVATSSLGATPALPDDTAAGLVVQGGLGVVRVPVDGYARGALPVRRPRPVFQTSTASRIWAYYEAMPEASETRRLVPPSVGLQPSRFNTPLLQEALKFSLSAGGVGLSQADQKWYAAVLLMAEGGGVSRLVQDGRGAGARGPKRSRTVVAGGGGHASVSERGSGGTLSVAPSDGESSDDGLGELARAFPTRTSFSAAVRKEQLRVLSKLGWDETPLVVEGVRYMFYSRDLLMVVLSLLQNAEHVQLWGEELGLGPDGTRMRSEMMDSDLFLEEEAIVRGRHGALSFVLAVQLFVDEAVVSWSGAHYMYPIRVRVPNVRDRKVQWVTVGHIPHVGKTVARTAAARRRASDGRNGVLQRCLAILLRRFVGASQTGVSVEFPGRQTLTAVPRLLGLVADQLGERSVVCLMGNACEYFCSHCMVRRDVAGGAAGIGAPPRDVTAVLDGQLDGSTTRDRDPRPSLRNCLKTEYSALAFVPAIGAIWGMATDAKNLYRIISFDLLHVWKLGVVRMVAQRFPSFLSVACAGQEARLGPVGETLESLNLRAWEMGHLNVPAPTPPGYVKRFFFRLWLCTWTISAALWPSDLSLFLP